jgi:hypothetical protein
MSPNSCLNIFYHLGDPVMDWESWLSGSCVFCSVCTSRTVREDQADSPRCPCSSGVLRVLTLLLFRSVVALSFRWAKFRTVRVYRADGLRVPGGQSACSPRTVRYSGSSLDVLFAFSDGSRRRVGRSAVCVRTVRGRRPDGPCGPCGRSAPPGRTVRQSLSALFLGSIPPFLLSCFRVCFKGSFLRLEADP